MCVERGALPCYLMLSLHKKRRLDQTLNLKLTVQFVYFLGGRSRRTRNQNKDFFRFFFFGGLNPVSVALAPPAGSIVYYYTARCGGSQCCEMCIKPLFYIAILNNHVQLYQSKTHNAKLNIYIHISTNNDIYLCFKFKNTKL